MDNKIKFGQYFTPKHIADFMVSLNTLNDKSISILEPSFGEGVFLDSLVECGYENIDGFEYDTSLKKYSDNNVKTFYESFITKSIEKKYDLIIGNPPYIRWKNLDENLKNELENYPLWNKYFNSLCDYLYIFILKSIELLKNNGELIFITPEFWLSTTHSISLRNYMLDNGYIEELIHFKEAPIFDKVASSIIIFKYKKTKKKKDTIDFYFYNERKKVDSEALNKFYSKNNRIVIPSFNLNEQWVLAEEEIQKELEIFENKCSIINKKNDSLFSTNTLITLNDICEIGNGMVSGLDKAFQLNSKTKLTKSEENKSINVVKAKDLEQFFYHKKTKYIFTNDIECEETLQSDFPNFYNQLNEYKEKLLDRYNYNRNINYWEWVFLRNYNLFNTENPKIFIPCKERISHKKYFRFSLIDGKVYPTQDISCIIPKVETKESIFYILSFLNNKRVYDWITHKGIIKGNIVEFSRKPISIIPFRCIDWNSDVEVQIHSRIVDLTKEIIKNEDLSLISELDKQFDLLF